MTDPQHSGVSADSGYVDVIIDVPVHSRFTYRIPEALQGRIEPGHRLYVPLRGRPRAGLAARLLHEPGTDAKLAPVIEILDAQPALPPGLVHLLEWISRYYFAPPGEVLRLMLPRPLRIRGKKRVRATAFGLRCLEAGLLSDPLVGRAMAALDAVPRGLVDTTLRKRVPGLTLVLLDQLAEQGLVEVEIPEPDAHRGTKRVRTLRKLRDPEPGARLGARQQQVLELLEGRGRVPRQEVQAQTGASAATIRSLAKRSLVEEVDEERYRDPFEGEEVPEPQIHELTGEQRRAIARIVEDGRFDAYRTFLLHGITGSGKTAVYVEAIAAALEAGKRALVLLPEIALTPQFVGIFRARFGEDVAVLHSGLTEGERFDQWRRIRAGDVRLVIGARSAIFAPLAGIGVIVVDEEHDGSFKQDSGVRYHARDLAFVRASWESCVVVLGTATPSLESYRRAAEGKSERLVLSTRPTGQPLPEVEVVDMRGLPVEKEGRVPLLSPALSEALHDAVDRGEQAILFLNRRGHSTAVICRGCGHGWTCPHCEIALTYHKRAARLRCHYCDYGAALPEACPTCGSLEWMFLGAGTEKLVDRLAEELSGFRIARLDRDTAAGKGVRRIIRRFRDHDADVLVGTQMVTKGHDFPRVTLVGVVMADLSLRLPDFRSGERTFQLIAQVAGRAGRGDKRGRVIVQTYLPQSPIIQAGAAQDYAQFAAAELRTRQLLAYPPFGHLIAIRFEGPDLPALRAATERYRSACVRVARDASSEVRVDGPVEAPLARLKGHYRWQMLLRAPERGALRAFAAGVLSRVKFGEGRERGVRIAVDVDPLNLL